MLRQVTLCAALLIAIPAGAEQPSSAVESRPTVETANRSVDLPAVEELAIHLKLIEFNATKLQQMGTSIKLASDFRADSKNGGAYPGAETAKTAQLFSDKATGGTCNFKIFERDSGFLAIVDSLQQNNLGKALAEPNIVVKSGQASSVHIHRDASEEPGSHSVSETPEYGTTVGLLATDQGADKVHIDCNLKMREIDQSHSVVVGGVKVPALTVRECSTQLDMPFGQTAVIAGFVQERTEAEVVNYIVKERPVRFKMLLLVTPERIASHSDQPPSVR
jgi:Flp pilus assembly secretin CpaC